ncbi:MAG: TrkH family potassium uptake protein [Candidatus Lambdaproteobacteria bacterium]|nr:TrkH family potassium uptake protein [Candidatus Lambdaproteobacteria bacterium]
MHLLPLLNVVGTLLLVFAGAQALPMGLAFAYGERDWVSFLVSTLVVGATGLVLWLAARDARELAEKDGFSVVTVGWIAAALSGALPLYLTGAAPTWTDAVFESMSGFTTTGASILTDYDAIGHGVFFWRALTHWLGGMGIIVLALVILPALGVGGMQLYKREVSGMSSEKLTPRLRDTAKALWLVYLVLTLAFTAVLWALGMNLFDAVNHAMATIATGGFGTKGDSITGFGPAIEWALILFMYLSAINFSLHYWLFLNPRQRRGWYVLDLQWRWYTGALVAASALVSLWLVVREHYEPTRALTKGTFQVVSIMTTTGFGSDDYVKWGAFPQVILLLAMLAGGCAGSTCGAIKWVRIALLFQFMRIELLRLVHPRIVRQVKLGEAQVTPAILANIFAFVFLYLTTLMVSTLVLTLDGNSFLTALGASAACLGGVGPGLGKAGPMENYAFLSDFSKWVLIVVMLLGRLELMTVFVLFMPRYWRA